MCGQCQGLGKKINSLSEIKEIVYDYNNMTEVTKTEIAKRVIDEFWLETYSAEPLTERFVEFVNWLDKRENK